MDASMSHDASDGCTRDQNPPDISKDYLRQERIKAKNRKAQRKYREKKLHEVDQYRAQVRVESFTESVSAHIRVREQSAHITRAIAAHQAYLSIQCFACMCRLKS